MGLQGERDIHKKVLDLPIPRYNPVQEKHQALAQLGGEARKRATNLIASNDLPRSLASQRAWMREQLKGLLKDIDRLVKALL